MKQKNFLVVMLALAFITGCKDDDKNAETFSELTAEQHKQKIEESGLNVIGQLNDFKDLDAIHVVVDFIDLLQATNHDESGVMTVLKPVADLQEAGGTPFTLKSSASEQSSLAQLFIDESGIYTYNPETQSWDKEESTDEITYHFPTEGSDVNNATVSVTNFKSFKADNPDVAQSISEDLLESVTITLSVDGNQLLAFELEAEYDEDDIPVSMIETYSVGQYMITTSVSRSNSKIVLEQSFTFEDANIISCHFENNGSFNYDVFLENSEVDSEGLIYSQDFIESSNVWVAVDNLKLQGVADWEGLTNSGDQFENVESEQQYFETFADVLNDNVELFIKYNDTNEIIAAAEFYAYEYTEYGAAFWDMDMRMKFGDGSYMDDSFFSETNFAEFIQEAKELINEIEASYGLSQE
ncbi:hypothetical protein ACT29H_01460 [Thermophagus sp. OGC60D27]|uniref:hypothetical protein n=1 Tax=Thermophagus sp. OGC60D27 TaxID=3458415 RepID=UPI0040381F69